jgi:hypothetical protein
MITGATWLGVSQPNGSDAEPGLHAIDQALVGPDPRLLLGFCSTPVDLVETLRQIRERSADAGLICCSTAWEIAKSVRTTRACG